MATLVQAGIEAAVSQQVDEFSAVVEEYWPRAFYFALQMLGNREDAMDVTQETFLRMHRSWARRDASRPVVPWLYSILRNLAIDQIRRRKVRKECDPEDAPEAVSRDGPEILAAQSELKARVWEAIGRLPEPQREVIILRDLHGLSYTEIAQTVGVPASTINSRLHDARETLRRRLGRFL